MHFYALTNTPYSAFLIQQRKLMGSRHRTDTAQRHTHTQINVMRTNEYLHTYIIYERANKFACRYTLKDSLTYHTLHTSDHQKPPRWRRTPTRTELCPRTGQHQTVRSEERRKYPRRLSPLPHSSFLAGVLCFFVASRTGPMCPWR